MQRAPNPFFWAGLRGDFMGNERSLRSDVRFLLSGRRKAGTLGGKSGHVESPDYKPTVYEFRLYAASRPDAPIDQCRFVGPSIPPQSLCASLAEEVAARKIDMAEPRVHRGPRPAICKLTDSARFPSASAATRNRCDIPKAWRDRAADFIATVIPKYLHSSIAGNPATPNPVSFGHHVLLSWNHDPRVKFAY